MQKHIETSKSNTSNMQDFLKTLAIIAMFIDHISFFFYPECQPLRILGRIVMPIFCFFAGYNCYRVNYRIIIIGIVASFCWSIALRSVFIDLLCSIFVGQILLTRIQLREISNFALISAILLFSTISFLPQFHEHFEYSCFAIFFMLTGAMAKLDLEKYKYYLLLNFMVYFFYSIFSFNFNFVMSSFLLLILSTLYYSLLLNAKMPIKFKCSWFARKSLDIYWLHLILLTIYA